MNLLSRGVLGLLRGWSRLTPTGRGGHHLVLAGRKLISKADYAGVFKRPDGVRMRLDLGKYPDCDMAVGLYELDLYRTLRRLIRPGCWFADCGANIGYFTLAAATWMRGTGRIDAFEPDPVNRARLEEHLRDNGASEIVHVRPVALAGEEGTIDIYHPPADEGNHGIASIYGSLVPGGIRHSVRTVRMDRYLDGVPDVIKMDIEGAEYVALQGMEGILKAARPPKLAIEYNPDAIAAAGRTPEALVDLIMTLQPRYRMYWIGWRPHRLEGFADVQRIGRHGNLLFTVDV